MQLSARLNAGQSDRVDEVDHGALARAVGQVAERAAEQHAHRQPEQRRVALQREVDDQRAERERRSARPRARRRRSSAPKATPVLRTLRHVEAEEDVRRRSPRSIASHPIALVSWSSATTTAPRSTSARAQPRVAPRSARDQADHDPADDEQHERRHDRAEVERARAEPHRRDEAAEQVQVRVRHVGDELEHAFSTGLYGMRGNQLSMIRMKIRTR